MRAGVPVALLDRNRRKESDDDDEEWQRYRPHS